MQFVAPIPFQEALDKLGSKTVITSPLSSAEWSDVPTALRERAFFSSRVENARFLQRGQDWINDFLAGNREALPDGQTALKIGGRARFVELMREFAVKEGMADLVPPEDRGGLKDIASQKRLELIFKTQTQQADDFGYRKQGLDPDVLDAYPAQRFIRVQDVKEPRDWHAQFEDKVFLKTSPIWKAINQDFGVPWGPWGWGCGHDVEDVDREEAEAEGLLKPGEAVTPPAPEDFNDNLKASTDGLDPELIQKMQSAFKDQVVMEDDGTMRWAGQAPERRATGRPNAQDRAALDDYTGSGYAPINKALRESTRPAGMLKRVDDLSMALSKLKNYEGTVYRGAVLPDRVLSSFLPGNVISEPGFTSASLDASRAFAGNVKFEVRSRTGKHVEKWSQLSQEREVMFDHGTQFKVISRDQVGGQWRIVLEEL
jgi:hypothetical protein